MKNVVTFAAALLLAAAVAQPASAQSPAELVGQAVAAQGGADALRGLKTLVIKGEAKHWEPGQSVRAGGETRFIGDFGLHRPRRHPQPGHPRGLGSRHEIRRGRTAAIQRDRSPELRRRRRRPGHAADVGHPARLAPARIHARFAVHAAARAGESEVDHRDRRSAVRRTGVPGGRVPCRDHALHRPVRSHQQAAGGGAHARRRSHLRRFRLRPRARRLEIRRRRAARACALVPPWRTRGAAPDLSRK